MPIEDIDYLLNNSEKNAYIVKVDSSLRDKDAYPTPSEFAINFDDPYGYVYGLDVIDVSMPSSMWNIENTNNSLKFHIMWLNPQYIRDVITENTFYTTFLNEIANIESLSLFFEGKKTNNRIIFIDQRDGNHVQHVLESTVKDNVIAMRKKIPYVPISKVLTINDDNKATYFRVGRMMYGVDKSYVKNIETLTQLSSATTFIDVGSDTFYYSYLNVAYETPITRENDHEQTIPVTVADNTYVHDEHENSPLPFQKIDIITSAYDDLYLIDEFIYYKDPIVWDTLSSTDRERFDEVITNSKTTTIILSTEQLTNQDGEWVWEYTVRRKTHTIKTDPIGLDAIQLHLHTLGSLHIRTLNNQPTLFINSTQLVTLIHYDYKYITNVEYANLIADGDQLIWSPVIVFNGYITIEPGNYDIFQYMTQLNTELKKAPEVIRAGTSYVFPFAGTNLLQVDKANIVGDIKRTGRLKFFTQNEQIPFMLDLDQSTMRINIGFSVYKSIREAPSFQIIEHPTNNNIVGSIIGNGSCFLTPPGVVYLLGIRYVVLRCPEIETLIGTHSFGANSPGIGVFKLALNQETVQQRLDFVHYVRKPFHPIEKLSRLTFRFELSDGSLYDFKGIDMFMILQINAYVPKKKKEFKFNDSLLNPNYDPDFIEYNVDQDRRRIAQQTSYEYDSDNSSTSDEEHIVKLQNKYLSDSDTYSSSSSDMMRGRYSNNRRLTVV